MNKTVHTKQERVMATPHSAHKRSLIVMAGLTPAVVTETLWALAKGEDRWIPSRVVVLSTSTGIELLKAQVEPHRTRAGSPWMRLLRALGIPHDQLACKLEPTVLQDGDREPVTDATDAASLDAITARFAEVYEREWDHSDEVVVAVAGGRNAMTFVVSQALSLLKRTSDRACQVLVDYPEALLTRQDPGMAEAEYFLHGSLRGAIEQCDEFYFPEDGRSQSIQVKYRLSDGHLVESAQKLKFEFAKAQLKVVWLPILRMSAISDATRKAVAARLAGGKATLTGLVAQRNLADRVNAVVLLKLERLQGRSQGILFGELCDQTFTTIGVLTAKPTAQALDLFPSTNIEMLRLGNIEDAEFDAIEYVVWNTLSADQQELRSADRFRPSKPKRDTYRDAFRPDSGASYRRMADRGHDLFLPTRFNKVDGRGKSRAQLNTLKELTPFVIEEFLATRARPTLGSALAGQDPKCFDLDQTLTLRVTSEEDE